MKKITLNQVAKKDIKIVAYLLVSGVLGYLLATYIVNNPMLAVLLAPAINYVLYRLVEELKKEGYIRALQK